MQCSEDKNPRPQSPACGCPSHRQLLIKLSLEKVIGLGQTLFTPLREAKEAWWFLWQPTTDVMGLKCHSEQKQGHTRPSPAPLPASGGSNCFFFMASLFHFLFHQSKQGNSSHTTDSHTGGVAPLRVSGLITLFVQALNGGRIFTWLKALGFLQAREAEKVEAREMLRDSEWPPPPLLTVASSLQ